MDYQTLGGTLAAIVFGAAAAWRRLRKRARAKDAEPETQGRQVVRESLVALIRGLHRAGEILRELADDLGKQDLEPARVMLLVAHNGVSARKTLRSQLKVRVLAEECRDARSVLDDWVDPRPMVGDYVSLLADLLERPRRAMVLDEPALHDRYPTLRRMYESEGITATVLASVGEHDGGLYYVSCVYKKLRDEDRGRVRHAVEEAVERLHPVVTNDLLSPIDVD